MRCSLLLALGVGLVVVAACQRTPSTGGGTGSRTGSTATPRIITLSPSATEVVDALGAAGELVGVDDYSDYPAAVRALPKVGSFVAPNLEAIVRLRPSVVVVDDVHAQASGALHDQHVATVECPMHPLPDVKTCLHSVGAAIGRAHEAESASAALDKAIE